MFSKTEKANKTAKFTQTINTKAKRQAKSTQQEPANSLTNPLSQTPPKTLHAFFNEARTITKNKTQNNLPYKNHQYTFRKAHHPNMRRSPLPKAQDIMCIAKWLSVKGIKEKSMISRI